MQNHAAPLGILGDGQLALMLGESANAQGYDFLAFGENEASSFENTFPKQFMRGSSNCDQSLIEFAERCSVITLENEFFSTNALNLIKSSGTPVIPDLFSYPFFEGKLSQRRLYESLEIPGPKWIELNRNTPDPLLTQIESQFKYPFVLKKSSGGYDGNGVAIILSRVDFVATLELFGFNQGAKLLIEEKVSIDREFAQGALFDGLGGTNFLPLVETVQRNGICELVLSRSSLEPAEFNLVQEKIKDYLMKLSKKGLKGLFNFEFFFTHQKQVLMNEGAPRPHNSQHLSIDACPVSQFDLLVKFCKTGQLPFPSGTTLSAKPGVMINLLGKSSGTNYQLKLPSFDERLMVKPKMYSKKECRPGRKMGHLNLIDPSGTLDLVQIGERALKEYQL